MATKAISQIKISDTITISECINGFWLYDKTQGMNLAMRAKTERDALIKALEYHQKRANEYEEAYKTLNKKIDNFISSVSDDEDED